MTMRPVREGELTKTVYTHIYDQQYEDAIRILHNELQTFPKSRSTTFPRILIFTFNLAINFLFDQQ